MKIGQYRFYKKAPPGHRVIMARVYPDRELVGYFKTYTPQTSTVSEASTTDSYHWKLKPRTGHSKYMPHQGAKECARRIKLQ